MHDDRELRRCPCGRAFRVARHRIGYCGLCSVCLPVSGRARRMIANINARTRVRRDPGQGMSGEHEATTGHDPDRDDHT